VTSVQKIDSNVFADSTAYYKSIEQYKALSNIGAYKKLKNYRGIRHILRLPVRGQRTYTNSKTARRIVYK
jgi:ribosomal protein S13